MNLFDKAKLTKDAKPLCLYCTKPYQPDKRNQDRGWGLFCSKSCAITWRNKTSTASKSDRIIMEREKKLKQLDI